jgi:hypothetical protein
LRDDVEQRWFAGPHACERALERRREGGPRRAAVRCTSMTSAW